MFTHFTTLWMKGVTRFLPGLLAQIKPGTNLCKLQNEIRKILHLLYQNNKITEKVYNKLIKRKI